MNLNKIIKESVKKTLFEKLSSIIYHYTTIGRLKNILSTNCMKLQASVNGNADTIKNNNFFYLSFTRQKSNKLGYSRNRNVRIEFNGDLLNANFKGSSYNYWGGSMGKHSYYNSNNKVIDYYQPRTENEDRLYSKKPLITDIQKYINRIDILIDLKNINEIQNILDMGHINNMFIYGSQIDFEKQQNNISWGDLYDMIEKEKIGYDIKLNNEYRTINEDIANILYFILYREVDNNIFIKESAKLLNDYGLKIYLNGVISKIKYKINNYSNIYDVATKMSDSIKILHDNIDNIEVYDSVVRMLYDYCKKHNIKSTNDAIKYKDKLFNKNNNYDFNLEIKGYNINDYFIYDLENTNVWDVVDDEKDAKENFIKLIYDYNVINRYGNEHKSKNDLSFYKYLQHLTKNKFSFKQLFDLMENLGIDNNEIMYILNFYKMDKITINFMNFDRFKYVNNIQKQSIYDKFNNKER